MKQITEDVIIRTSHKVNWSLPIEEIRESLLAEGFSDGECFLIYQAAKLLLSTKGE